MKILSIGNSFSQDAQRYFYQLSKVNGQNVKCVNLFIGGCSLKKHYINILNDEKKYSFEFNGKGTGIFVSIKEALCSDEWDYVTIQQVSSQSFDEDSYVPYVYEIIKYIKTYAPKTKIIIHKTWAYPDNKEMLHQIGFKTTSEMFYKIDVAYTSIAEKIGADGIIPSAEAMHRAYLENQDIVFRDSIHASRGFGRYLLANVWYKFFFGETSSTHIEEFDVPVSAEEIELIERIMKGEENVRNI